MTEIADVKITDENPFDEYFDDEPVDGHGNPVPYELRAPREIAGLIAERVRGQEAARRAAAMTVYHTLQGRRCTALFAGPTGCGKSEIWRTVAAIYPGLVRRMDFSRCQAAGWRGDLHLRDAFEGVDPEDIRRRGLIVVLDEADKILCESAMGAGGTDYNRMLQNELLLLLDGDMIEFAEDEKLSRPAFQVDASRVSVVLLGAFERVLSRKSETSGGIGFGSSPRAKRDYGNTDLTADDLVACGMRREVAGRVQRIVQLRPLSEADYRDILTGRVIPDVGGLMGCSIAMDGSAAAELSRQASRTGLGVRWMAARVREAIDDMLYDDPDAAVCRIAMDGGRLRCRAPDSPQGIPDAIRHARELI